MPEGWKQSSPRRGQVTAEYFVLFAVIGLLTVIAFSAFDDDVRQIITNFYEEAVNEIAE